MPDENDPAHDPNRRDHPAKPTSDPESTWGANDEDKAAWEKKYGKRTKKDGK